jgi:hypothetical protein
MFGGILNSLNPLNQVMNVVNAVKTGDIAGLMSSISQLALTYATGGAGAMFGQLGGLVSNFGAGTMANALTGAMGVEAGLAAIQLVGQEMGLPQSAIDAAQAAFGKQQGDWSAQTTNARQAGMGGWLDTKETEQANVFLDMIKDKATQQQSPFSALGSAILAGPNAGPAQLGGAQGLVGGLMNSLINSLVQSVLGGMAQQAGIGGAGGTGGASQGLSVAERNAANAQGPASADNANNRLLNDMLTNELEENSKEQAEKTQKKKPGQMGAEIASELGITTGGFLMQFAILMGEALDKKTDDLMKIARQINQEAGFQERLNTDVTEKKGGFLGIGGSDEVNQDKQNAFTKDLNASNSRLQTLSAIQGGISKEMDAMQNALKTAMDSIGQSQAALARRQ